MTPAARGVSNIKFLQWFDECRRVKILAIHLSVDNAVCINNGRLREMVEALGAGDEMKSDIAGD